jgi:GTPase SAR1 family protein
VSSLVSPAYQTVEARLITYDRSMRTMDYGYDRPEADSAVYDISSRGSFDELVKWLREIETYCSPDVCKVLVGNKVDRVRHWAPQT